MSKDNPHICGIQAAELRLYNTDLICLRRIHGVDAIQYKQSNKSGDFGLYEKRMSGLLNTKAITVFYITLFTKTCIHADTVLLVQLSTRYYSHFDLVDLYAPCQDAHLLL